MGFRGCFRVRPPGQRSWSPIDQFHPAPYPGEFAFRTRTSYYLTAINGSGRTGDPTVITSATSAGPAGKPARYRLAALSYDKLIQTATGNYLTAVNGGGMTANVLHTDATQPKDWERFRLVYMEADTAQYAGSGQQGNFLTAWGRRALPGRRPQRCQMEVKPGAVPHRQMW
ncbi:MAG: hypothetical protein U0231_01150 [Nitrospiraceae bacterium]